ncbi:oligosaccharide flippase family protein [Holdemanella porci]|uniref:oligosaccharide flippase family protein n=1 Tax=Holdemanella porci TaxID=2652276 RepID=UPI003F8E178D
MAEKSISLKKEASLLTISKMTNLLITMATSMLLSRFRSLEEYGTYSELSLVLNLLTTLCMLGIPNAINYFLPRTESADERRDFLQTFFSLNTLLSIIAGIVMAVSVPVMVWYFKNEGIYGFYYFAVLMPWAKITIQERGNLFVASNKTKTLIWHTIANSLALLGIILLTKLLDQNFQFYMILYVIVELIFAGCVYYQAYRIAGGLAFRINWSLCRSILAFSVPIGVSDMVSTISREVDKLMIGGFLDTEALAIYTNSAREIALTVISTSFIAVLMPKLSKLIKERKVKEAVEIWKSTTSFTYIFMCFGVAALVVFAPQVITILYSEKYLPGTGVFRIYSLILLWRTAYFGTMLSLHGETKKILYCSIASMLINVVLNYVLYVTLGFCGPAWSTFISIGIVDMLQLKLSARITGIPVSKLFPWMDLLRITLINVGLGSGFYLIIHVFNIQTDAKGCAVSIILGIVWMLIYFGIIMRKQIKTQWKES